MQHVTGAQRPSGVATELPQGEGAFAAQIVRHVESAAQAEVAAYTLMADFAHM